MSPYDPLENEEKYLRNSEPDANTDDTIDEGSDDEEDEEGNWDEEEELNFDDEDDPLDPYPTRDPDAE